MVRIILARHKMKLMIKKESFVMRIHPEKGCRVVSATKDLVDRDLFQTVLLG